MYCFQSCGPGCTAPALVLAPAFEFALAPAPAPTAAPVPAPGPEPDLDPVTPLLRSCSSSCCCWCQSLLQPTPCAAVPWAAKPPEGRHFSHGYWRSSGSRDPSQLHGLPLPLATWGPAPAPASPAQCPGPAGGWPGRAPCPLLSICHAVGVQETWAPSLRGHRCRGKAADP